MESKSVKGVIANLAEKFRAEVENTNHEYCLRIPKEVGSGYVKAYEFDFGVGVVEIDILLNEPLNYVLEKGIVHPLKFMFNRESSFKHSFEQEEGWVEIKRLENAIASSSPNNNHHFKLPAKEPICIFILEINRKVFEEKIESFLANMTPDLIQLFRDVNGINQFFYKGHYSLEISKFMEEFTNCELDSFMKQVYLEGKAYEILTHQLQQYLDDLNTPDKRLILRQATIESIEEAVSIIKMELESTDNVLELAKRVGLNQNTLQNGFKQLYKTSVNEYIRNFRIETAKNLMESTSLNITEITYKVGINSRSYFSKLFKKKYGVTPKQYVTQIRKSGGNTKSA